MNAIRRCVDTLKRMFAVGVPETLMSIAKRPRPAATRRLYILEIDFSLDEQRQRTLDEQLDPLRKKFGLDFFVVEPGMKLKRFDDY